MKPGVVTLLAVLGILIASLLVFGCTSADKTGTGPAAGNIESDIGNLTASEGTPLQHDYLAVQNLTGNELRKGLEELRSDSAEYYFDFKSLNATTENGRQLRAEMMTYFSNVNSYAINMIQYADTKDETYRQEAKPYQAKINSSLETIRNLYGEL
ncbi:MAG: hypothetical protein ABFC24_04020 [Methanoregulaceae archaeon]